MAIEDLVDKAMNVAKEKLVPAQDGADSPKDQVDNPGHEAKKSAEDSKLSSGDATDNDPASGTIPVSGNN